MQGVDREINLAVSGKELQKENVFLKKSCKAHNTSDHFPKIKSVFDDIFGCFPLAFATDEHSSLASGHRLTEEILPENKGS